MPPYKKQGGYPLTMREWMAEKNERKTPQVPYDQLPPATSHSRLPPIKQHPMVMDETQVDPRQSFMNKVIQALLAREASSPASVTGANVNDFSDIELVPLVPKKGTM